MLKDLLIKNRSYRNYDNSVLISKKELECLVELTRYCPMAVNLQNLRYRIVFLKDELLQMQKNTKYAGLLKDKVLPYENNHPVAYIVICTDEKNQNSQGINLGISAQTILLGATEMGYNGCMVGNFNKVEVKQFLNIDENLAPLLVIALGKAKEKVEIKDINIGESQSYYRNENDVHIVPKLKVEDLLI